MAREQVLLYTLIIILLSFGFYKCPSPFTSEYEDAWKMYKVMYNRTFGSDEEFFRRAIWESNVRMISRHNLEADMGIHSFKMGVNKFSDRTSEELKRVRGCMGNSSHFKAEGYISFQDNKSSYPSYADWRKKGYVTPVKDQGNCGSCWAFSTTGSLEGQQKAKSGKLVSLSEQNLVDCSRNEGNEGCDGGLMSNAFRYIKKNKGVDTEQAYPYKGKDGPCKFKRKAVGATCRGYSTLPKGNETSLMAATATVGPISVAIDAQQKFMQYKSGIFYDPSCSSEDFNHAVLVVGYDSQNGRDYWIVKNSWGTNWGINGYIYMSRNRNNNCGIANLAGYPIV